MIITAWALTNDEVLDLIHQQYFDDLYLFL